MIFDQLKKKKGFKTVNPFTPAHILTYTQVVFRSFMNIYKSAIYIFKRDLIQYYT